MNTSTTVNEYMASLPQWQRDYLELFRTTVHEIEPNVAETIKWGVPVFMVGSKMVFAMSAFKEHVKYNFIANGALLDDSAGLFNNGLESKKSRSIDRREGDAIDHAALANLVRAALTL